MKLPTLIELDRNNLPINIDILINECVETFCDRLCYLKARWKDEKEYEDFNDYRENIKNVINQMENIQFLKMNRDFKVHFLVNIPRHPNGSFPIEYKAWIARNKFHLQLWNN